MRSSQPRQKQILVEPQELAVQSRTLASQIRNPDVHRSYLVPVLSKALHIMRVLDNVEGPLNIQEVCELTGFPKTTVYRILRTLSAHGYIPHGADGVYSLRYPPAAHDSTGVFAASRFPAK